MITQINRFWSRRLSEELLRSTDKRPEPWVALARYCEMKHENEKALQFLEKVCWKILLNYTIINDPQAISINPRHSEAYLAQGI